MTSYSLYFKDTTKHFYDFHCLILNHLESKCSLVSHRWATYFTAWTQSSRFPLHLSAWMDELQNCQPLVYLTYHQQLILVISYLSDEYSFTFLNFYFFYKHKRLFCFNFNDLLYVWLTVD